MQIVLPKEMREIERESIIEKGMPSIMLMENAAAGAYRVIKKHIRAASSVLVLAGGGNNGGDALAVARWLFGCGFDTYIKLMIDSRELKGDAKVNYDIIRDSIMFIDTYKINDFDFIVDGIFGTGLNRNVSQEMKNVFFEINNSGKPVYSIDIPSGLCAETGNVLGGAVRATRTITMGYPKIGLFTNDGPDMSGEIDVIELGLPRVGSSHFSISNINEEVFKKHFMKRKHNSNKGSFGKVLCIGGSNEMRGAVSLAARGAFAAGAGLVYIAATQEVWNSAAVNVPEAIGVILKGNASGCITSENIGKIIETAQSMDAVLIGPGMKNTSDTEEIVKAVTLALDIPVIIDADGINAIATRQLNNHNVILTPHPGEAARLLNTSIEEVQKDRLAAAVSIAQRYHAKVVLKGTGTIITDGTQHYVNTNGNPSLAVAGTGDVLAGIIASLVCKRNDIIDMAACGTYLHGRASDEAACEIGIASMTAGKLINYIERVMKKMGR